MHHPVLRQVKQWLPLFGAVVLCGAVYLLYRALSQYDPAEIVPSLLATSLPDLALGALFVAASYVSLTLFDALAVRYIGARLPYRRIALASFSALAIGHTLGFAAASSGAIRYRFYSRWGIRTGDIAKIILFCAMTVGLGLNTLAGLTLVLQSEVAAELLGFSEAVTLALGAACLVFTALYVGLAAVLRRPLGFRQWEIAMPPLTLAIAQVAVGTMNFCCVAAVLYHMMRSATDTGYVAVATAYVLGNVATLISHAPGGLGVYEAVVIYLVPQAATIGALVAFRVLYFLIPFAIGALLFVAYELVQRHSAKASGIAQRRNEAGS